jgi:putative glycosyltransferase
MKLSVVSTLYRSESCLREFHRRVTEQARAWNDDYEIVLVNDGSPDRSLEIALGLQQNDPRLRLIDLSRNFGHHRAILAGLRETRGDLVFLLDSDLEEPPEVLPELLQRLRESQADVVYGVQSARAGSPFERLSGFIFYSVFNLLSTYPLPRNLLTLRLMTRRYVDGLLQHGERETVIAGLWAMTGFHQEPVVLEKGSSGWTDYNFRKKVTVLVDAVTSFSAKPLVYIFYLGSAILLLSSVAAVALVLRVAFFGALLAGWASLIISIWLLGGMLLFSLGIVGIYLSRVFIETKKRPPVIIRARYE